MLYRALDSQDDFSFGHGLRDFLENSPEAVGQAVKTRLRLLTAEWFLDITEGTPYATKVLGPHTQATYDLAIRERILDTPGVVQINNYQSRVEDRTLIITAEITTIYGQTTIEQVLP